MKRGLLTGEGDELKWLRAKKKVIETSLIDIGLIDMVLKGVGLIDMALKGVGLIDMTWIDMTWIDMTLIDMTWIGMTWTDGRSLLPVKRRDGRKRVASGRQR